jgi:hypothetical protein
VLSSCRAEALGSSDFGERAVVSPILTEGSIPQDQIFGTFWPNDQAASVAKKDGSWSGSGLMVHR